MGSEFFSCGVELRAEGRRLVGPAINYGDVSPSHRERFEAGAFNLADGKTRYLDLEHNPNVVIAHTDGGGLELRDGRDALEIRATLPRIPAADAALEAVRAGKLKGFSIEFNARGERREAGIRVIESAELLGIGVVRSPSYKGSLAEVRGAWKKAAMTGSTKRQWARSTVPTERTADCECAGPNCDRIRILASALDEMIESAVEGALDNVVQAVTGRTGPAENLGTTATGAVKLARVDGGMRVELTEAAKNTPAGRALAEADAAAPAVVRPLIDHDHPLTVYTEADGVRVYESAFAPVLLVKSAPGRKGWNGIEFFDEAAERAQAPPRQRRRRMRAWV